MSWLRRKNWVETSGEKWWEKHGEKCWKIYENLKLLEKSIKSWWNCWKIYEWHDGNKLLNMVEKTLKWSRLVLTCIKYVVSELQCAQQMTYSYQFYIIAYNIYIYTYVTKTCANMIIIWYILLGINSSKPKKTGYTCLCQSVLQIF